MQSERITKGKALLATGALFLAEACGVNTPVTSPTPLRTPETTPSPIPTLNATPTQEATPIPTTIITPSATPEIKPSPTPTVKPNQTETPTPTETPVVLKTGEEIVNADHPNIKIDKLTSDVIAAFEGNDTALSAYEAYMGDDPDYNPENQTKRCGKSYPMWEDRASECEYLVLGLMETYVATKDERFYNLTSDAYSYFVNLRDIPTAEKERFSEIFVEDY